MAETDVPKDAATEPERKSERMSRTTSVASEALSAEVPRSSDASVYSEAKVRISSTSRGRSTKYGKQDDTGTDDDFADAPEDTRSLSQSPPTYTRDLTRTRSSQGSGTPPSVRSLSLNRVSSSSQGSSSNGVAAASDTASIARSIRKNISTESLDEVSLDDNPSAKHAPSSQSVTESMSSSVSSLVNRFSRGSVSSQTTISSTKPTTSRDSPTTSPVAAKDAPPPAVKRSPFSWLRSSSSNNDVPKTTPVVNKRQTNSSVVTTASSGSNEKADAARANETLRENFKKIKERELSGEPRSIGAEPTHKPSVFTSISAGLGITAVSGNAGNELDSGSTTAVSSPIASPQPTLASLKEEPTAIDWDLWQAVVDSPAEALAASSSEIHQAIQNGIPQTIRGTVWQALALSKNLELEVIYKEVLTLPPTATAEEAQSIFGSFRPPITSRTSIKPGSPNQSSPRIGSPKNSAAIAGMKKTIAQLEKVIKRDLGERTSFGKYKVNQTALLNICKAYALFDPEVGYTQGMTFIVSVLLLNMSEEEAFCLFVTMMCKYDLRGMFQDRMKGLELRLFQYDRILEDFEPRLAIHLRRQHIESSLYAAPWFLTLFTYKLPLQLVLRVFDLVIGDGLEGSILKFGILLMRKNASELLKMDMETLGPFLKERLFDVYIDSTPSPMSVKEAGFFGNGGEREVYRANEMVRDACTIEITKAVLDRYEAEWMDAERIKYETERELETLRTSNTSMSGRIKKLEDELNELNTEHVVLANETVTMKVENARLADQNEALTHEVEELKKIVDTQPAEVEATLRQEMDRILKRNLEVHNEMQQVEEHATHTEKELINTKMQLATVNESYELLKKRWDELRKALD